MELSLVLVHDSGPCFERQRDLFGVRDLQSQLACVPITQPFESSASCTVTVVVAAIAAPANDTMTMTPNIPISDFKCFDLMLLPPIPRGNCAKVPLLRGYPQETSLSMAKMGCLQGLYRDGARYGWFDTGSSPT